MAWCSGGRRSAGCCRCCRCTPIEWCRSTSSWKRCGPTAIYRSALEHNVRTYVHRLRAALDGAGERIETARSGYRLRLERHELDATRFEDLVAEARTLPTEADPERTRQLLDEALDLWGGSPYGEFADEEWARAEVARLREVRASAIEHRFAALLDAGRHTEVIGPLAEAVTEEPWRETRRIQLALALYRSGRQTEALEVIRRYRSELAEELGLEPSPDLGQLEHRILEHDPALLPSSHQQHRLRGYQLDEVIGEGAFSLVWRGTQPSLGRTVAIKQIRAELANQPDFVRRFETEAQTVAALEHPYIVPLYDYWREPDSAYLVMRHVAGGTLEAEVLDHGLDESRSASVGRPGRLGTLHSAPGRGDPPRREVRQRLDRRRRQLLPDRLRYRVHRVGRRRRAGNRTVDGVTGVRIARAAAPPGARRPHRHLRLRNHTLRSRNRPTAVRRRGPPRQPS